MHCWFKSDVLQLHSPICYPRVNHSHISFSSTDISKMALTPSQRTAIQQTWAIPAENPIDSGEAILLAYFERFPHNQEKFLAFRNVPAESLKVNILQPTIFLSSQIKNIFVITHQFLQHPLISERYLIGVNFSTRTRKWKIEESPVKKYCIFGFYTIRGWCESEQRSTLANSTFPFKRLNIDATLLKLHSTVPIIQNSTEWMKESTISG